MCFKRELHLPETFLALGFMFSTRCSLTKPYSCNFMLTRQVLLTKVIHVLNQVQNKTAFIHYFYKAIMNDSLACDSFHKNYEPFTSLLVTWERLSFWFMVVFLGGLAAQVNDQILVFVLIECLWALPSLCCVSDDSGNCSGSARQISIRLAWMLGTAWEKHNRRLSWPGLDPLHELFLSSKGQCSSQKKLQKQSFCWQMPSMSAELHPQGT